MFRHSTDRRRWLITGVAGFIGSQLLESLLMREQEVVGLDNFSTGYRRNLHDVQERVGAERWARFTCYDGDIRHIAVCRRVCLDIDVILHHAGLASIPCSYREPLQTSTVNIDGFLNILVAAADAGVKRVVYASSSAVYGDQTTLPIDEVQRIDPSSPYAISSYVNELHADLFARRYGISVVGLRYFNVFGARQDPNSAGAAVIPRWIDSMVAGRDVEVHGDGKTSHDFCAVANVVQANLLAATTDSPDALNQVFNIGGGERITLNELYALLRELLTAHGVCYRRAPVPRDARTGGGRQQQADITKARRLLGYSPQVGLVEGLTATLAWYLGRHKYV